MAGLPAHVTVSITSGREPDDENPDGIGDFQQLTPHWQRP